MVEQRPLGLIVAGIGGIFLYNAVETFRASGRKSAYEPVEAEVLDSTLDTDSNMDDTTSTYIPRIEYEYTVDGETHVSDNLYPGPVTAGSNARDEQQQIVDRSPEGETVEAFYDPEDPADAFLESESQKRQAISLGVLGIAGLVS
jgi:hypothetical protein